NPQTVPVQSVAQLTAYLKARPGKVAYGSGNATGRIATELYRSATGFEALYVPYTGVPTAIADLIAGRIQFMVADATYGLAQVRAGKVRALAVTTAHRLSSAPEIPTMAEAGIAGYDIAAWFATFLPAGAPADIVATRTSWCNSAMTNERARDFLRPLGAQPFPGSPTSLASFVQSETEKWGKVVRFAGIQPE
ncbi:MAG: tripartite tricarboxylate transporter substrate binding protein, partial [Burkholderiales bacterium]|nr:tripartite tricarboxylate transporter substrate binding protein [Burkholderiales bacterium]